MRAIQNEKITVAEIELLFGSQMPMEAAKVVIDPRLPIEVMRERLAQIARSPVTVVMRELREYTDEDPEQMATRIVSRLTGSGIINNVVTAPEPEPGSNSANPPQLDPYRPGKVIPLQASGESMPPGPGIGAIEPMLPSWLRPGDNYHEANKPAGGPNFKVFRGRLGRPAWYQRFVEAWWILTGKWSLTKAWRDGRDFQIGRSA